LVDTITHSITQAGQADRTDTKGERLQGWQWLGVGVVVAGLVLFEKASGKA
jgi:hypothetical protein